MEPKGGSDRLSGGKAGWLILGLGLISLVLNHWLAVSEGEVNIWLLLFGPLLALFGLATIYDRRILTGASKHASTVPRRFRVIAVLVAIAALAISAFLAFGWYRIG